MKKSFKSSISSLGQKAVRALDRFWESVRQLADAVSGKIGTRTRTVSKREAAPGSVRRLSEQGPAAEQPRPDTYPETYRDDDRMPDRTVRPARKRVPPIRRRGRQRVYRLQGYTTVSKINSRRKSEKHQRTLRQLLLFLIIVILMFIMFHLYNPVRDLTEWYRIIGIKDLAELAGTQTTASGQVTVTPKPSPTTTPAATASDPADTASSSD